MIGFCMQINCIVVKSAFESFLCSPFSLLASAGLLRTMRVFVALLCILACLAPGAQSIVSTGPETWPGSSPALLQCSPSATTICVSWKDGKFALDNGSGGCCCGRREFTLFAGPKPGATLELSAGVEYAFIMVAGTGPNKFQTNPFGAPSTLHMT